MKSLLLLGAGGHCRSCIDVVESTRDYEIAGLVERSSIQLADYLGYPVLGTDDQLPNLLLNFPSALIAVGQIKSADIRIKLYNRLKSLGANLPVVRSPLSYCSKHAIIGSGTIVMHQALVNINAKVGENCIINTGALVEHDANIGSHCHISTGAKVNGNVTIGSGTFVGSGVVVREGVNIGPGCVIGAGTVVLDDLPSNAIYHGIK